MTKSIRVIICDDEEKARRLLKLLLEESKYGVEVVGEASNLPEAVVKVNELQPDILFLDIEMPQFSGLQILDFFPDKKLPCELVFVTAYNEFAMQAFRLSALDYLLKPATMELLEEVLIKHQKGSLQKEERLELLKQQLDKPFTRIALPNSSGFQFVNLSDILYIEADGMYSHIYLMNKQKHLVSKPLIDFEKLLSAQPHFFKIHRKFLINMMQMKSFNRGSYDIEMSNGDVLPLSRQRKQDFEEEIHQIIPGRN